MKRRKTYAIILAAGSGERIGKYQKQFFHINRRPILFYSLDVFVACPLVSGVVVVVPQDRVLYAKRLIARAYPGRHIEVISGGRTRRLSSYNGLRFIKEELGGCDYVIFHDGVRPLLSVEMVEAVTKEAQRYGAAVLGSQVLNVVAVVKDTTIVEALHPKRIYNTQTPHCYKFNWILGAHEAAANKGKRCANHENIELVHALGKKISIIDSFYRNMKLTFPQDIVALKALLKKSQSKGFFKLPCL